MTTYIFSGWSRLKSVPEPVCLAARRPRPLSFFLWAIYLLFGGVAAVIPVGSLFAKDIYVAQTALGSGTGADAADAMAVGSLSWGTGGSQVNSNDTVYIVGTINGLGIGGSNVTVKFLVGSKISGSAASPNLIYCANYSNVTIDGQGWGVIEFTDNGTDLAYHNDNTMVAIPDASNFTIRGVFLKNGYVHTSRSDTTTNPYVYPFAISSTGGGFSGALNVQNCVFSNECWCVNICGSAGVTTTVNVQSNYFVNYDHGVSIGGQTNQPLNINVSWNTFDTTSNWDTYANNYHHDGIHYFADYSDSQSFIISHNTFTGNWGSNNTAHVFLEGIHGNGASNVVIFNNVFVQWPGDMLNNGFLNYIPTGGQVYNNKFLGSGDVVNSCAVSAPATNMRFVSNVVSGVTTFLSSGSGTGASFSAISNNIYANAVAGGNPGWRLNLNNFATFAGWRPAVGDVNSTYNNNINLFPPTNLHIVSGQ